MEQPPTLVPLSLKDAPALIETVFPAQKVSYEAQRERKAVAAQTLTGLGSYWKGRKPLILVRAIVLGSLLPPTDDAQADLAIFEQLMAFDDEGLARRALAANAVRPAEIAARIVLDKPWDYFKASLRRGDVTGGDIRWMTFPLDADAAGIALRWQRDLSDDTKLVIYRELLATHASYEGKAGLGKRPEEVDQAWLYAPVWGAVNRHYAHLGIHAHSFPELVEQLGILRYGHRPRVGDTFSGGGSIPFEAARLGCDAYASDLNPVACMLTWGALNVIGASPGRRAALEAAQQTVFAAVDRELTELAVEHDAAGNRAKAYLYCLEARCPETGWWVPLAPSWVISPKLGTIAKLVPDAEHQRFDIEIVSGASAKALKAAEQGTVQDGDMVYVLDGKTHRTPIKTLRGDYRKADGSTGNRLRHWELGDFRPRADDIFQERLYAIQWISRETLAAGRQETFFAAPTADDLERERRVDGLVAEHLARWQRDGLVPDMAIEPGDETTRLFRERGWTHWHHLHNARQLVLQAVMLKHWRVSPAAPLGWLNVAKAADFNSRLCRWATAQGGGLGGPKGVFSNQALNTFYNYATRAWAGFGASSFKMAEAPLPEVARSIVSATADRPAQDCEFWITDPPYADAVNYHEITEFFIAWLRKNPPKPFDDWVWDSRRALAIKGAGEDFRHGMVAAYRAMAEHMPANGMQCVMFTHQDTTVWGDLIGIFWAAGLQVVAAWYIATETTSELKQGGYVQGTVILMLRKRAAGERAAFKQRLLPAVRAEVQRQIETMLHLNDSLQAQHGEPVFNDADLQMAGYAAALKVLTAYTRIGDEDVTRFALRPRARGELTVVDEIVSQAA
ncbi:MAG TPA: anti-phage-associated DUF1156 domain-containing protein, partial [Rhodanobacteraceae bacterium]|nr:anti-phage-associated DUF1156 domain-containing protein [Rhodanobacteraceae bacterium]